MFPLKKAVRMVPTPIGDKLWRKVKATMAEQAVRESSRQTRMVPKLWCILSAILFTSPSIGITAKPEWIVNATPMDKITHARKERESFSAIVFGWIKYKHLEVPSIKAEYRNVRASWISWLFLNCFNTRASPIRKVVLIKKLKEA